jgi:hypothetical protein
MIFSPESIDLINRGVKTQTRRPVKGTESPCITDDGKTVGVVTVMGPQTHPMDDPPMRAKWRLGNTYAVCPGRGKRQVARIRLTSIRCERVGSISNDDARAEGITGECGVYHYGTRRIDELRGAAHAYWLLWQSLYPKSHPDDLVWALGFELEEETK